MGAMALAVAGLLMLVTGEAYSPVVSKLLLEVAFLGGALGGGVYALREGAEFASKGGRDRAGRMVANIGFVIVSASLVVAVASMPDQNTRYRLDSAYMVPMLVGGVVAIVGVSIAAVAPTGRRR